MDFWRGLCLVDMLLVHLVYNRMQFGPFLQDFFGEYARFAAGGFVVLAGIGVGRFYLPKVKNPATRNDAHLSLWRRATVLLCAYYLGTMLYQILDQLLGFQAAVAAPWQIVRDVILLRRGDDLLLFYVIMTVVTPILLAVLRRRFGWAMLGVCSALLFWFGSRHPDALPLCAHPVFRPLLWQAVFVTGLLAGAFFDRYESLGWRGKLAVACSGWAIFALLFVSDYGPSFGWPTVNLGLEFWKSPLSFGEMLRYFAITTGLLASTDLLWPWLKNNPITALLAALGRQSLMVYVAHTLLVLAVAAFCDQFWWWGKWQMTLILPAVGLLWVVARIAEVLNSPQRQVQPSLSMLSKPAYES